MNLEQARFNMIEQQIRPWEVLDQAVLDTFACIPREKFVPRQYQALAFADIEVPIGHGEHMMFPRVEGRMLQALAVKPTDVCLEVGTGSGFITACLAYLGKHVDSVDLYEDFINQAEKHLLELRLRNHSLRVEDGLHAIASGQSYDVIAVTGSVPSLAKLAYFEQQLALGGRLFCVVGQGATMQAMLIKRTTDGEFARTVLFETYLRPLVMPEEEAARAFVF